MPDNLAVLAYTLAAMAGICFVGGMALLTRKG